MLTSYTKQQCRETWIFLSRKEKAGSLIKCLQRETKPLGYSF